MHWHFRVALFTFLVVLCRPDDQSAERPAEVPVEESIIALGDDPAKGSGGWVEGTRANGDGATRSYFNRAARLRWKHRLGDFCDADGKEQGSRPFAKAAIGPNKAGEWVDVDVTELVRAWVRGKLPNHGFYLRLDRGVVRIRSRENPSVSTRPQLVVSRSGGEVRKGAAGDTYLDASTSKCFGDLATLYVDPQRPTLLRFDLSDVRDVSEARLRVFVEWRSSGGQRSLEVYRCTPGNDEVDDAVKRGLAADYVLDRGIAQNKDVVLFAGFEAAAWRAAWTSGSQSEYLREVDADLELGFRPLQGKALRVVIRKGKKNGLNMDFQFRKELGVEPEEMYFRYYLRISNSWHSTDGGKLPGFAGTYGRAGWGGRKADGTDGWSARGLHRPAPVDKANPLRGYVPIGNYVYHADMDGFYGTNFMWTKGRRGYVAPNRWYCIEQHIKLNDPKQKNGVLRAWIDGRLAFEKTDLRFRLTDALKIERLWMNVYHGGTKPVAQDSVLYIDNVVIARRYIGPRQSAQ